MVRGNPGFHWLERYHELSFLVNTNRIRIFRNADGAGLACRLHGGFIGTDDACELSWHECCMPADMARIMHVGLDGTHVAWALEWHDTCIPSKLAWTLHAPSRPVTWHDCCLAEGQPRPDTMLVVYSTNTPTQPMTRGHGLMPAELNASHSQAGVGGKLANAPRPPNQGSHGRESS